MASGHQVDIPVTDLDDEEDDIILDRSDVSDVFNMDYEIDNNSLHIDNDETEESLASKLRTTVTRIFGRKNNYRRFQDLNSYELEDRNRFNVSDTDYDDDSAILNFKDFTDLGIDKIQKTTTVTLKRYQFYLLLASLLLCFIGFVVVLAKTTHHKSSTSVKGSQKIEHFNGTHMFYPTTILISLDGFHPHYISSDNTPFMHEIFTREFGAPFMIPSFPSSTFPNHWTLVTGLYPGEHGIVGNTFFDPVSHKQFVNTNPKLSLQEQWWGGEPLWLTASKQGVSSAVHMWPGSEVPFKDPHFRPMEITAFNGSELLSEKADQIFAWLDRDVEKRPELILTYVPTIDSLGHKYGIGDEIDEGLAYVDSFVKSVSDGLKNRSLDEIVNLVIVSDHGMAPTSNNRVIFLDDIVNLTKIEHIDGWPLFGLRPYLEYSVDQIFEEMTSNYEIDSHKDHYDIFTTENLPHEWNFGGNITNKYSERLAPLWIVPKVGYSIIKKSDWEEKNHNYTPKGVHGYNNTEVLMRALFLGTGPYFEKALGGKSLKVKPFANVELYNIICDTLGVNPLPNNGSNFSGNTPVSSYISRSNLLLDSWVDQYDYPNVSFTHEINIMRENATYDLLFKPEREPEVLKPETTILTTTAAVVETSAAIVETTLEETATSTTSTPEPTSSTDDEDDLDEKPISDNKPLDDDKQFEDDKEQEDDEDDEDDDHKHGFKEIFDDIIDDISDAIDDVTDSIEDAFDNIKNHDDSDD